MNPGPTRAARAGSGRRKGKGPLTLGAALFLALAGCAASRAGFPAPAPTPAGAPALDGLPLRVLLKLGRSGLRASAPGGLRLLSQDGATLAAIPATAHARLSARDGRLFMDDDDLGAGQAWVLPLEAGDTVRVSGKRYRGRLLLKALGGRLALINVVGLEDYLRGVLPCEVESGGPKEALEAQAVAARGFALWESQRSKGKAWDLDNSSDSQVYGSREAEKPSTDAAVRATRGQVLAWRGALARTYFHSNSGGATADAQEVWSGSEAPPYLSGVLDTWSEGRPHYRWTWSLPLGVAQDRLERAGLLHGALEDVEPGRRTGSGRWRNLRMDEGGGRVETVGANAFRRALGGDKVRSTRFSVELRDGDLVFRGLGWGHGVGMSQEGAFAQARAGWDYRAILYFYYPGTELASLRE